MAKRLFGLPVIIFIVAILAFLSDMSNSITSVTVPLLALNLGASYEFIGTMVALSAFTRLVFVQPIGILSDKVDKRIFLTLGFLLFFINFLILVLATQPIHILIGRILQGIGSAMFYTTAVSLILLNAEGRRGIAVGIYGTLMGFGFSMGPIIGGFIAEKISYTTSYLVSAFLALSAIGMIILGVKEKNRYIKSSEQKKLAPSFKLLLKNKEILIACIGGFFISEAIGADTSFFPVFGKNISLSEGIIGGILGIRAFLSTIIRIPVGKATEKIGSKKIMFIALSLSSLGLFLVPQFRIVWLFPFFLGLEGIGFGMFHTSVNTFIGEVTDDENKGAAIGLYYTFSNIGSVLNMTILGFIAGTFGVANTFRFTSIMCLVGLIINLILSKTYVQKKSNVARAH